MSPVRGFPIDQIGPSEHGKPLGGDWFWVGSLNWLFSLPLPQTMKQQLKGQVFFNAGNLVQSQPSFRQTMQSAYTSIYSSVGVGLSFALATETPPGLPRAIELSLCYPLFRRTSNEGIDSETLRQRTWRMLIPSFSIGW